MNVVISLLYYSSGKVIARDLCRSPSGIRDMTYRVVAKRKIGRLRKVSEKLCEIETLDRGREDSRQLLQKLANMLNKEVMEKMKQGMILHDFCCVEKE
ncbi:hypothetical protein FO519_010068 [Halicephalobus sp. NKZ332]|nr:hypothetical protein FO519_010068 [Halicephalobus sp. NKZ332]